jgi:hypothetical protein
MPPSTPVIAMNPYTVKVNSFMGDQLGLNILHCYVTATTDPTETEQNFADALSLALSVPYRAIMSTQAAYLGIQLFNSATVPTPFPTTSVNGSGPGGVGVQVMPGQVTGMITKQTSRIGRANRGRMYIPFPDVTSSVNVPPVPSALYTTRLDNIASITSGTLLVVTFGAVNITLQWILHKNVLLDTNWVTSTVSRRAWATQRRRGDYGRKNSLPF